MKYLAHNFVIVEGKLAPRRRSRLCRFNGPLFSVDTMILRFALRHCLNRETAHYSVFECRNEATYLLSRKCSDEYYGWQGPCCKVDDAMNFLVNEEPRLFSEIKFMIHADDDTYWRVDQLMAFLAAVDKAGLDRFPIIGNAQNSSPGNMGVWHINNCKEIMAAGWFQPMLLNHAALERLKIPSASYGLMDTCRNFDVTHDVGMEVYAWLMQFHHLWIPKVEINGDHQGSSVFKPDLVAVHAIKHDDADRCHSGEEKMWPNDLRYQQHLVVGCGDIDTSAPFHDPKRVADMYDAYRYFRDHGKRMSFGKAGSYGFVERKVVYDPEPESTSPETTTKRKRLIRHILSNDDLRHVGSDNRFEGLPVETAVIPNTFYIGGYETTAHFKKNNITGSSWKEFTLNDCKVHGKVSRHRSLRERT